MVKSINMQLFKDKRFVLFLFSLTVLSLVLLAGGLNNVSLRRSLYTLINAEESQARAEQKGDFVEIVIPQWVIVAGAILAVGLFVVAMFFPKARKYLLTEYSWRLMAFIIVFSMIYFMMKAANFLSDTFSRFFRVQGSAMPPPAEGDVPDLVFVPMTQPSNATLFIIMLVIALVISLVLWRSYFWWQGSGEGFNPLDDIADMARMSLRELSQQAPSRDAIIHCYENMNYAVTRRRGLDRKSAMTAAEFAQKLKQAGLPEEPVNHLTRLFETARYSSHTSTQKDIDEAVLCLTTILRYCEEKT
jgi:hypothetical protein